ncbi:V-type proton ATPase 116 kDa subunit a-like isoform X2 [Anneissia japonica]|uniref:V-type proton ATPase 116 kDa subunit a-like isoform X2 n=1 Tax=Anneissia japonica TaxID=1529436 RepID=UPI001425666A|nr:V-type proton ATPase 116 kDa subunit a-like isoform X2 [Anneissia japonica]
MGSLFRSEEMTLAQLFLQSEAAYACVAELGELGLVQFRDLNPEVNAFQRKFVNEVRRCDEMERKLRYIEKEVNSSGIKIHDAGEHVPAPAPRELIDLEAKLDKLESELREVNSNQEALNRNYLELQEQMNILRNTQSFFNIGDHQATFVDDQPIVGQTVISGIHALGCLSGVINRDRLPAFEQMLWRVSRGNIFLRYSDIEHPLQDPTTGDDVYKCVFVLFFQGEQLGIRARKICEGFRASLYPCPEDIEERKELTTGIQTRIQDLQMVLNQTHDHRQRLLVETATTLHVWFIKVNKMKAIYHTLNLFNLDAQRCLIAECWCPVDDLDAIQLALRHGTETSGASVPSILNRVDSPLQPPTCNKTNKFTSVFQDIIDAYGVASYREVNPAPYAIITFPFLFAIMFGDAGHGLLMALFGLWLLVNERKLIQAYGNDEVFGILLGGRYIIFLMGIFSIYTGLIYNDVFSKSLKFFDSSWNVSGMKFTDSDLYAADASYFLRPQNTTNGIPYPYGMDPIWQLAGNKISWLNSYKMKMSIIIGISQMVFGVILSVFNYVHFKKYSSLLFDFIPQIIFLLFIFAYMVVLIVVKWFLYDAERSQTAPSLIITIINMFLLTNDESLMMYQHQYKVQIVLVVLAVLCIPWMLFARPVYQLLLHRARLNKRLSTCRGRDDDAEIIINDDALQTDTEMGDVISDVSVVEENFQFGEALIYQGIHTIEYCLGCISHTASYLRLWALSLAHAELSEVLWSMVLKNGLSQSSLLGCVMLFGVFAFWAVMTVCILLLMEALSAFLHTLRLHWVEFQSKFYSGEGHPFKPFSFQDLTAEHQE